MFDVLQVFYTTNYNFAAFAVLLLLLLIFLLTKKNYKWSICVLAVFLIFNVAMYKRTDGKTWTITIEPEKTAVNEDVEPVSMTFSAKKNWTITDDKGVVHHWCWVDDYWQRFASMDLVSALWGDNKAKKMMKSSEGHASDVAE